MWFKELVGFEETSPENVRNNLEIKGDRLVSRGNGRSIQHGKLEILSLSELRKRAPSPKLVSRKIQVSEIVANVKDLHCDESNSNSLFQAASQFNLLEMVNPNITPENGVDTYQYDPTQGPACAIACGAGTIYRNYFVPVNGRKGQTFNNQIDCLDLIGKKLNNEKLQLWQMKNGYALLSQDGLHMINTHLSNLNDEEREEIKGNLKVGIQWDTEVTMSTSGHLVSQVYCSALPVAYSKIKSSYWETFARLILEATYEATLHTALINQERTKCNKIFLTLVGGGAFGNGLDWILESMQMAIRKFENTPLDIKIVSYGHSNKEVVNMINAL